MSIVSPFKRTENKHDVYRGKNCMKKFCESLRDHGMETINFKIVGIMLIGKSLLYLLGKKLKINMLKIKNMARLGTIAITHVNIEVLYIAYVI